MDAAGGILAGDGTSGQARTLQFIALDVSHSQGLVSTSVR